jgi:hypothetical protein
MAIKHVIVLFVETPRKFITAVINLRGVSTNKTIIECLVVYIVFPCYLRHAGAGYVFIRVCVFLSAR